jgi:hypothetical protein
VTPEVSDNELSDESLQTPAEMPSATPRSSTPARSGRWPTLRRWFGAHSNKLAFLIVAGAIGIFGSYAHHLHRVGDWLTVSLAHAWLFVALFSFASLASGLAILARSKLHVGSLLERTSLALAVGVLAFALGIFVAGYCALLGTAFFFAWPALLLLFGRRALLRYFRVLSRLRSKFGAALFYPQNGVQALAALAIAAGTFTLYVQVISPANIGFDVRQYHLPVAESYAAAGRIRPFPEGWYLGAYPQLGGWLYTWAFLAPGALKHHISLAGHLEFVLFLMTIASTSALASRLISGTRLRHGGAALFLFPSLFLNANLGVGADHIIALWAAPLALALLRYLKKADVRNGALLGMFLGGAILSKYQAIYFFVPITFVLAYELVRKRQFGALLTVAGVTLLVSSPHWLKNLIAYHDPFYPNLHRWFPDRPFFKGADELLRRSYWFTGEKPELSAWGKLVDTLKALFRFSFFPLTWARVHDDSAVVGSLFTLLLPLMLWVRPRWRVLLIAGCCYVGIAIWWNTYPDARYLQPLMPWMAACVAVTVAAAWRTGSVPLRAALVTLVGLQIVWGGDNYLLGSQQKLAAIPLQLPSIGKDNPFPRNPYPGQELAEIGERLPKGSRLVGHDFYQSLGVGVPAITDNPDWQGSIDYLQIDPPDEVRRRWLSLGGTHVIWPIAKEGRSPEDMARDTVFGRSVVAFTDSSFDVAGYRVAELIDRPAPKSMQTPTLIAWLGCEVDRTVGIYTPSGFAKGTLEKPLSHDDLVRDASGTLAEVNTLWFRWDCDDAKAVVRTVGTQFTKVLTAGKQELWVRTPLDAPKK